MKPCNFSRVVDLTNRLVPIYGIPQTDTETATAAISLLIGVVAEEETSVRTLNVVEEM